MKVGITETMWVVVNRDGDIIPDNLSYTRKYCIYEFVNACGNDWEYWKKQGCQCIKILVTISRKEATK